MNIKNNIVKYLIMLICILFLFNCSHTVHSVFDKNNENDQAIFKEYISGNKKAELHLKDKTEQKIRNFHYDNGEISWEITEKIRHKEIGGYRMEEKTQKNNIPADSIDYMVFTENHFACGVRSALLPLLASAVVLPIAGAAGYGGSVEVAILLGGIGILGPPIAFITGLVKGDTHYWTFRDKNIIQNADEPMPIENSKRSPFPVKKK